MPDQVITAVPATNIKRKNREEEEDSDDEGSDVVSGPAYSRLERKRRY
jgi:hypothetical protein